MARVPYVDLAQVPPEHSALLARRANIYRALANSPKGLAAFATLASFIRYESRLDARLRELAILMVGYLTGQPYEWSHHIEIGRKLGVSDDDVRALIEEAHGRPNPLEPLAKAVLTATREMTFNLAVSDATFADLRAGLDNERIVDLILTIAFYNGVVQTLGSLDIDVEDGYQRYLDEFPLPNRTEEEPA